MIQVYLALQSRPCTQSRLCKETKIKYKFNHNTVFFVDWFRWNQQHFKMDIKFKKLFQKNKVYPLLLAWESTKSRLFIQVSERKRLKYFPFSICFLMHFAWNIFIFPGGFLEEDHNNNILSRYKSFQVWNQSVNLQPTNLILTLFFIFT